MALYKLEQTPDLYIAPTYFGNKYVYRMVSIGGESKRSQIRNIDLRHDKLMIYGTEITEPMMQMLHDSLVLRPKTGVVYVNCNGACYFYVTGKGTYRSIYNVIYDWSRLGVVAPNSINDSLKKKLEDKDEEIKKLKLQVCSTEADALSTKANFDASKKEIEELKERIGSIHSKLQSTEGLLEVSEKNVIELKEQIFALTRKREEMDEKVRNLEDQYSSAQSKLQSTKLEVDVLNKNVKELENQLRLCRKENEDHVAELQRAQDELYRVQSKSTITKKVQKWLHI